jgi:hypothetical protein
MPLGSPGVQQEAMVTQHTKLQRRPGCRLEGPDNDASQGSHPGDRFKQQVETNNDRGAVHGAARGHIPRAQGDKTSTARGRGGHELLGRHRAAGAGGGRAQPQQTARSGRNSQHSPPREQACRAGASSTAASLAAIRSTGKQRSKGPVSTQTRRKCNSTPAKKEHSHGRNEKRARVCAGQSRQPRLQPRSVRVGLRTTRKEGGRELRQTTTQRPLPARPTNHRQSAAGEA